MFFIYVTKIILMMYKCRNTNAGITFNMGRSARKDRHPYPFGEWCDSEQVKTCQYVNQCSPSVEKITQY